MIAGIITIPERIDAVHNLLTKIAPSVDSFKIFTDTEKRGHWFNYARCMDEMLSSAKYGEPVLVMTDDATTVSNWRERWEKIHKQAKSDIYVLFARQKHLFTEENIQREYVTKLQARGYYDQASIFINRPTLMKDVLHWFNTGGNNHPKVIKRQKHLDVVIQEYLLHHNIPWTITTPTLFDHLPIKSSLNHKIGSSPLYVGNTAN